MLMLPDPRRDYTETAQGTPVARHKRYVLSRIGFGPDSEFTGLNDVVAIDPTFVDLDNLTDKETVGVRNRWSRIEAIYAGASQLPTAVQALVRQHQSFMASGDPVTPSLSTVVLNLEKALAGVVPDWMHETDALPALESILGIAPPSGPALPPPDEIGEEEPIVSARSAHEYRLAKMRGASGRQFSSAIRSAYRNRCAFCGGAYGGSPAVRSGLDAAHILAWSRYDLDVITNGISLCKLHHWAFDAALLMPVYEGSTVRIRFTELATENFASETLARLGVHDSPLQPEWLPYARADWPSRVYLERLYGDLGVVFADSIPPAPAS